MQSRLLLLLAVIGLSAVGATCKGQAPETPPQRTEPAPAAAPSAPAITELQGVELTRVPAASRGDALRILNESFCYCGGCTRTVASCLANRSSCSCEACSDRMAEHVIAAFEAGASTAQVESQAVELFSEAYNAAPHDFDVSAQGVLGPADAPHTLVEFADFKCPHCRSAFGELVEFVKSRDDVKLAYFFFPLSGFGEESIQAARAAEAARLQGKFWEMATLLYQSSQTFDEPTLLGFAQRLGLDLDRFQADLAGDAVASAVLADKNIGGEVGVMATPTIFLDGRPLGLPHSPDNLALRIAMEDDRNACH